MTSNTPQKSYYLGVHINLGPKLADRRITITFHSTTVARKYLDIIQSTEAYAMIELELQQPQETPSSISLRLPSTVVEIGASTTYGGFTMKFSDKDDARMWQRDLVLWRFLDGSETEMYVVRDVSMLNLYQKLKKLNKKLPPSVDLVPEVVPPLFGAEPGPAETSNPNDESYQIIGNLKGGITFGAHGRKI